MTGSTLIELMIVFMIIGIFVAVAVPAFKDYKNKKTKHEQQVVEQAIPGPKPNNQSPRPNSWSVLTPEPTPETKTGYVDGLRIDNDPVYLMRHNLNDMLYACQKRANRCYKVVE